MFKLIVIMVALSGGQPTVSTDTFNSEIDCKRAGWAYASVAKRLDLGSRIAFRCVEVSR